jgi:hypothetical protein
MSRINGDKARSAIAKRRRTVQRMRDRVLRSALEHPAAAETKPVRKAAKKPPATETA